MNKSQEQRVVLTALALALTMVGSVLALQLASWVTEPPHSALPPSIELPVADVMLLTPEEREEARKSGVGAFEYDGVWYVDHTLPTEYCEGNPHE